ncbi:MAG: AAA family ATPase, partial [Desulfobacteraceae bacterium]
YISQNFDLPILSLDDIRREHHISPTDKKGNGKVIQLGKEKAKEYLRQKQSFIFNATNLSRDVRNKWTSLFHDYKARITIIYLEVPYNQLLAQNQNRDFSVPHHVIGKLIKKWEIPGFEEAHEVDFVVKDSS